MRPLSMSPQTGGNSVTDVTKEKSPHLTNNMWASWAICLNKILVLFIRIGQILMYFTDNDHYLGQLIYTLKYLKYTETELNLTYSSNGFIIILNTFMISFHS